MAAGQRFAVPGRRDQRVRRREVLQRHIGGVAVIARQEHEARLRPGLHGGEKVPRRDPVPAIVEARPRRHAVNVGRLARRRETLQRFEGQHEWHLDGPEDVELPAVAADVGLLAQIEHGPVLDQMLAGRKSIGCRRGRAAGEKAPFLGPALLGRRELGFGRNGAAPFRSGSCLGHGPALVPLGRPAPAGAKLLSTRCVYCDAA